MNNGENEKLIYNFQLNIFIHWNIPIVLTGTIQNEYSAQLALAVLVTSPEQ